MVYKKDIKPARNLPNIENLEEIEKRLITAFANYPIYGIKNGVNMTISILPTDNPEDIFLGRYKEIRVKADSVISNKVKINDFQLVFEDVQVNIYDLLLNGKLILFSLEKLTPKGTINFDELEEIAIKALKGKGIIKVKGLNDSLVLDAQYDLGNGKSITGSIKINLLFSPGESIRPIFESIKIGPFDIPDIFFRKITNAKIVLTPTKGWPLKTNIQSIKISPRKLYINPA